MADAVAGLLPAAGTGERLGRGPKAFVEVAGRPLLVWAAAALAPWVDELAIAVPDGARRRAAALLERWLPGREVRWVGGGPSRQATVARLLEAVASDWVIVHDAARPFLDGGTVRSVLAAMRAHGACSVGVRVADTLVRVADGAPVDRAELRAVQTPQAFRRTLLLRAHAEGARAGATATDDAGLVWRLGEAVAWVEGGTHLFKVTTPADLRLAEAVAAGARHAAGPDAELAFGDGATPAPDPAVGGPRGGPAS